MTTTDTQPATTAAATTDVLLDVDAAGDPFPRIHEGRYEPDPVTSGITPVRPRLVETVHRAGVRLMRLGVGVWLPGLDPKPKDVPAREWFTGTADEVGDASKYSWAHLDRNLDVARELGADILLSVDYMPASLAASRAWQGIPEELRAFAPKYRYPDGVRTGPPQDPQAFAQACAHLFDHLVARGQRPRYVELWNEPDLPFWWSGSFDEYWEMYCPFAHMARAKGFAVGGPSWAGALAPEHWRDELIARAAREDVPLDFYSWHCYKDTPEEVVACAREVRSTLDAHGLTATQSVLDEWGYTLGDVKFWGSAAMAAFLATALVGIVDAGVSVQAGGLLIDPKLIPLFGPRFMGIARRNGDPNPVFHCLEAFEQFQATPHRIAHSGPPDVLAGTDAERRRLCVIVPNSTATERSLRLGLGGGTASLAVRRLSQRSFDKRGGWEQLGTTDLTAEPAELTLPAHTITVLEGPYTP